MPDQNNPAFPASPTAPTATSPTDQSAPQTNQPVNPVVTTDLDIPPLPPDFQNIQPTTTPTPMVPPMEKAGDSGSAAPSNLPPIVSTPKKKFGGKRIIATILGVLLLVGGVGAGLVLTQQQQLFNQKAMILECFPAGTKISLSDGEKKNIESLQTGDVVVSENEQGGQSPSKVSKLLKLWSFNMSTVVFESGTNLKLTNPHPLFTKEGWKAIDVKAAKFHNPGLPIGQLAKGDFVKKEDGSWDKIISISTSYGLFRVYNLTVDNNHDYFADGFMAHNKVSPVVNRPGTTTVLDNSGNVIKTTTNVSNENNSAPANNNNSQPAPASPYCTANLTHNCQYGCSPNTSGGVCNSAPIVPASSTSTLACKICQLGSCVNTHYSSCNDALNGCSTNADCSSGSVSYPVGGGNGSPCSTSVPSSCANGYTCVGGSCQGNPTTSTCGRNNDIGAPVCCTGACTGQTVCEAPHRQECLKDGVWCTINANSPDCGGGTTIATTTTTNTTSPTAQCSAVSAYNTSWNAMTAAQLSTVTAGTTINFCVNGNTSAGGFDMAKFTINGVAQAQTTTVRPGSTDYCQNYVIPAGVSSFNVTAQIHHATLGWSN